MSEPHVSARGLVLKGFPDAAPVDFILHPGSHWLIVGESGAGKTTLVKSLLGMISIARGEVALFGQSLDGLPLSRLHACRRRVATMFSSDGLMPAWTGYDNLALPLRLARMDNAHDVGSRVHNWIDRYQIPTIWLDSLCGTLSRDARLTLALARALIKNPDLLILDGVPIDNALAYRLPSGLAMLRDFVRHGGSLLVLTREAYVDRYTTAAQPLRFQRAQIEAGRLRFSSYYETDVGVPEHFTTTPQHVGHGQSNVDPA